VWLGASHRINGSTGDWENDAQKDAAGHDQQVSVPAGANNQFTRSYTLPATDAAGSYDLTTSLWENKDTGSSVMQRRIDKLQEANKFTVAVPVPTIYQDTLTGVPGTVFNLSGSGFTPGSSATLHFKKPDGSEYPPQKVSIDSAGKFTNSLPTGSAELPGTYTWWAVDTNSSKKSNELTYTLEAVTGSLHHFEIADIGGTQVHVSNPAAGIMHPAAVTIRAKDINNNTVTYFNGEVKLFCGGSMLISPTKAALVNGQVAFNILIMNSNKGTSLTCQMGNIKGKSDWFDVIGVRRGI